jgi:D-beta-D-heptose 7-phosphate kinase/D-beta-D-heptose 1-phosphate adenosyltransferase
MTDIESFKEAGVLVVGDVMLDRYCWGTVNRISPEAPVPIVRLDRETVSPGGAANVAANAAALGANVCLIGMVGNDAHASDLRSALSSVGIDDHELFASDLHRTIVKTRILAHGQQVVRLDSEDSQPITRSQAELLVSMIKERLSDVGLVILSDYGKGLLSEAAVRQIIEACKDADKPLLADPKGKHFDKYAGATVLTPNRREAAEACKIEESDPELVRKAGERLLAEHSLSNVLITESENGMTLFQNGSEPVHFETAAREVFDVTGAGDTVIGCLGVALAAGMPIVEAARISNIAAGLSVLHIGTVAVAYDELQKELRNTTILPVDGEAIR